MNDALSRLTSRPSPISKGVYICASISAFRLLLKVHVDQQQSRLDACHVERQHAGRLDVEGRPSRISVSQTSNADPAGIHISYPRSPVYPVREISTGTPSDMAARHAEVSPAHSTSAIGGGAQASAPDIGPCSASAAICSDMSSTSTSRPAAFWRSHRRLGSAAVQRSAAPPNPRDRPVVDDLPRFVAPRRVPDLADGPSAVHRV